jgi:hypothetical protein
LAYPFPTSWSRDGRHVFVDNASAWHEWEPTIWLAGVDDGTLQAVTPEGITAWGAWPALDGKALVFTQQVTDRVGNATEQQWICTMTGRQKSVRRLTKGTLPRLSPDGKRIAFLRQRKYDGVDQAELWVMRSDGSRMKRVLAWPSIFKKTWKRASIILGSYWLSDSRALLVGVRRGGNFFDAWVVDETGKIMQIIANVEVRSGTLDGTKFVISGPQRSRDTWLITLQKWTSADARQSHRNRDFGVTEGERMSRAASGPAGKSYDLTRATRCRAAAPVV